MENLKFTKVGCGHFNIWIEIDGQILETTTTNSLAIDCAFDDTYDLYDNEDRFYESQEEARETLINQILRDNA